MGWIGVDEPFSEKSLHVLDSEVFHTDCAVPWGGGGQFKQRAVGEAWCIHGKITGPGWLYKVERNYIGKQERTEDIGGFL